jgi:hypothetical protein
MRSDSGCVIIRITKEVDTLDVSAPLMAMKEKTTAYCCKTGYTSNNATSYYTGGDLVAA